MYRTQWLVTSDTFRTSNQRIEMVSLLTFLYIPSKHLVNEPVFYGRKYGRPFKGNAIYASNVICKQPHLEYQLLTLHLAGFVHNFIHCGLNANSWLQLFVLQIVATLAIQGAKAHFHPAELVRPGICRAEAISVVVAKPRGYKGTSSFKIGRHIWIFFH